MKEEEKKNEETCGDKKNYTERVTCTRAADREMHYNNSNNIMRVRGTCTKYYYILYCIGGGGGGRYERNKYNIIDYSVCVIITITRN